MKESYEWVLRAILNSRNKFHFDCCHVLIMLFERKYGEEASHWTSILNEQLIKKAKGNH